jgi:hypothetical protein
MSRAIQNRPHLRRDPVVVIGTLLVLALVAVLPLALAFASGGFVAEKTTAEETGTDADDAGADDAGIGSGLGELSAAALSALHRDLNSKRNAAELLPAPETCSVPHFLTAFDCPPMGSDEQALSPLDPSNGSPGTHSPGTSARYQTAPTGPGPDGIPLLF